MVLMVFDDTPDDVAAIQARLEPDIPRRLPSKAEHAAAATMMQQAKAKAVTAFLDGLNPHGLELFIRDYLVARSQESQDLEHVESRREDRFNLERYSITYANVDDTASEGWI